MLHAVFEKEDVNYFYLDQDGKPKKIDGEERAWELNERCKQYWRVRVNSEDAQFTTFSEIGVPPKGSASAGRMNPAGISYFYVAYEQLTAEKEVVDKATKWTIAKFETLAEITIIDFVNLPNIRPSFLITT